jgi:outer membrane protein assembly factor BamB
MKILPVILFLTNSLACLAQDWTRFRGPHGTGVSGPQVAMPEELGEKAVRWKIELPGKGTSSPVLWGTKLFLTAESTQEGQRQVLCYDATSGKELWAVVEPFEQHGHHEFNNFASSTPAVDAKHLYIAWTSGKDMHVLALTHDGKPAWRQNLGYYQEEHGSGASPVVVGNVLLVSKDHEGDNAFITGLDTATGKEKWKVARKSVRSAFSTPIVIPREDAPGKLQAVYSSNPDALTSIDPETGKVLWNQAYGKASRFRSVGSPCEADGVILASVGQGGGGQEFAAVTLKNGKPEIAWEGVKGLPYVPTPIGHGEHFYVLNDGGNLTCLEAKTGKSIYKERLFNNAYSSPVVAGDRMLCISRTGEMAIVKLGTNFEKLTTGALGEPCDSTPAIANGLVFIRSSKHLQAIGGSAKVKGAGVSLELGSDAAPIQAGKSFHAALRLTHEPGYHTYWKFAGIAGIPMTLDWNLPAGWKASETLWAPPEKVMMGQLRTHGYEKDTLLVWEITPPANLPAGQVTHLPASLRWMCCATRCHPGYTQLNLTVTAGSPAATTEWGQPVAKALAQQPPALANWTLQATREGEKILLTGNSKSAAFPQPLDKAQFFSDNGLVCSHEMQAWTANGLQFSATLPVANYVPETPNRLSGLLYHPAGWDDTKVCYARIDLPLAK